MGSNTIKGERGIGRTLCTLADREHVDEVRGGRRGGGV